jgi:hypothetical protein
MTVLLQSVFSESLPGSIEKNCNISNIGKVMFEDLVKGFHEILKECSRTV